MKVGSLFSGVGGFDLGLERGGHEVVWQAEFDKQARSVLRRHWPGVDLHEDVRHVGESNLARVDLLCGGFPCQDVSVAGKREGLAGERSGLWWEFHRIIGELAPAWVLIENVPGLLSSNDGRDTAVIVRGLEELGYGWTYRILDSQYFGVAQRRRRVFIVGRAGGFCPPEILLEPESVFGDSAPSRTSREEVAGSLGGRADGEGGHRQDLDNHGAYPLQEVGARTGKSTDDPRAGIGIGDTGDPMYSLQAAHQHGVAAPLTTKPHADHESQESKIVVAHSLTAEGFDASGDGTVQGTPLVADTLRVGGREQLAGDGPDNTPIVVSGGSWPTESVDRVPSLTTRKGDQTAVFRKAQKAHDPDDCERWEEADYANTLNGQGDTAGVVPLAPTLTSSAAGVERTGNERTEAEFVVGAVPRRLTPTECERLQGFPDGWTEYGAEITAKGKPFAVRLKDGPRYRMMGNAVTVDVIEWIGRRLPADEGTA